jgi:hypothetical protein
MQRMAVTPGMWQLPGFSRAISHEWSMSTAGTCRLQVHVLYVCWLLHYIEQGSETCVTHHLYTLAVLLQPRAPLPLLLRRSWPAITREPAISITTHAFNMPIHAGEPFIAIIPISDHCASPTGAPASSPRLLPGCWQHPTTGLTRLHTMLPPPSLQS